MEFEEHPGVAHDRRDLGPVPDHPGVCHEALDLRVAHARDRGRVEVRERRAQGRAPLEHDPPAEARLERLEAQALEQRAFVARPTGPLVVVVRLEERGRRRPPAARQAIWAGHEVLRCSCTRHERPSRPG